MQVKLAYGKAGLAVDLPFHAVVIKPGAQPALTDEVGAVAKAIASPIGAPPIEKLAAGKTVCVVTSDFTRPVPNKPILQALLPALERAAARSVKLLIATGLHRPNTREELCAMFGEEIVENYEIVNHLAREKTELAFVGNLSDGAPLWVNKHYLEAECKILTGFIEPHFFAGFSGGRKAILPGIAGEETIRANHQAVFVNHPKATFGQLEDNPVHLQMLEAAKIAGVDFIVNVAINPDHKITGVFAGDLEEAHRAGVEFVRKTAMAALDEPFDLVIATNNGYPMDLNLYQAVKGLAAAAKITRPGGSIILAAQCSDGIGGAEFEALLKEAECPKELLAKILTPSFYRPDQWTAQILARILEQYKVYLYTDFISPADVRACHMEPISDIEEAVAKLCQGRRLRIGVLPQGPLVIPYLTR